MTFSLTARCPDTGMFGMVISSSSPAVAARCVHLRAKVGAVASQNITDPALGQIGLDLLARGLSAREVCDALVASTPFIAYRQLVVVDARGRTTSYSGSNTLGIHATHEGEGAIAAGNMLANAQVPVAMVSAYRDSAGKPFVERLLSALEAGLAQGRSRSGSFGRPLRGARRILADRGPPRRLERLPDRDTPEAVGGLPAPGRRLHRPGEKSVGSARFRCRWRR